MSRKICCRMRVLPRQRMFRPARDAGVRRTWRVAASSEARELLEAGRQKYDRGDRMGAVNIWEKALSMNPSVRERQVLLYSSTCVHASFGDAELAQVTLRDAIAAGLDFEQAMQDPELPRLQASQQVIIQLRKFAQTVAARQLKAASERQAAPRMAVSQPAASSSPRMTLGSDLSDMLSTEMTGIDTSVLGVVKRVAGLLAAMAGLGVLLFYVGLKYAFPNGI